MPSKATITQPHGDKRCHRSSPHGVPWCPWPWCPGQPANQGPKGSGQSGRGPGPLGQESKTKAVLCFWTPRNSCGPHGHPWAPSGPHGPRIGPMGPMSSCQGKQSFFHRYGIFVLEHNPEKFEIEGTDLLSRPTPKIIVRSNPARTSQMVPLQPTW